VSRFALSLALFGAAVACSAKSTTSSPPPAPPPAIALAAGAPQPPPPDPREVKLSAAVVTLLEHQHLLGHPIDDTISRAAFTEYLDRLDGAKMFLLQSDRDALGRYSDKIDDELHSGRLDLAHEGQKIWLARVAEVDKFVADLLASPMNHDDEEFIELDPKKLAPAASDDELKDRWRKRLELEVMEHVASMEQRLAHTGSGAGSAAGSGSAALDELPIADIPTTPEAREAKARAEVAKTYAARFKRFREPGPLDAAADLVNAVTAALDPHTDYLPPAEKANFDIAITGSLEGIGASLRERDDLIEVSDLVPGGAAWRQGKLAPGDLILSVQEPGKDPIDIVDMRLDDVVGLIRGPKGTVVRLTVRKPDGHQEAIAITRDVINIEESYARGAILQRKTGGPLYGYIHLPSFYGGANTPRKASTDVRRLVEALDAKHVAGIILDIREDGGGLLRDAVDLTGEFIDKGPVVQVRDHAGDLEVMKDEHPGVETAAPMVVMVDQFSASASEILAGALQDYRRALIVGTGPTHGKGTVQAVIDLDRDSDRPVLGVLKITIQQFFRVSGASTQLEGVTPDITLPNPASYIKSSERTLDHAIPFMKIAPAPHDEWKVSYDLMKLQRDSTARVSRNTHFAKIAATAEILAKWRDDTKIPLQRSAWDAREKKEKDELAASAPELDKAAPTLSVKTLEDPVSQQPVRAPGAKPDDRLQRWQDSLSRDPWVDESVSLLGEMK
jgi:carboxyl-terminal processing protease